MKVFSNESKDSHARVVSKAKHFGEYEVNKPNTGPMNCIRRETSGLNTKGRPRRVKCWTCCNTMKHVLTSSLRACKSQVERLTSQIAAEQVLKIEPQKLCKTREYENKPKIAAEDRNRDCPSRPRFIGNIPLHIRIVHT